MIKNLLLTGLISLFAFQGFAQEKPEMVSINGGSFWMGNDYTFNTYQQVDDYVQYHLPFGPAVKLIIYNTDDHVPAILRLRMEDRT